MQTHFSLAQLADPDTRAADKILRTCVHCGFCTATCPTYLLLGDERDSPRGRIVLIQDMLESRQAPDSETVLHLDRCLSCLGCMTTCPSGVNYMHLIDQARAHIHEHYRRPWPDRALRWLLGRILPNPFLFGIAATLGRLARPFAALLPASLKAAVSLAPVAIHWREISRFHPAQGPRKLRVALSPGCVQRRLMPDHAEAAIRVLNRFGAEIVVPDGLGCCGAINLHLGEKHAARRHWDRNLAALSKEGPFDHVVAIASGCGTMLKEYAPGAADVTEVLNALGYRGTGTAPPLKIAYHPACSLEHGQNLKAIPRRLLQAAGFELVEIPNSHLCCGSAGTYNLLQPQIAAQLKAQKIAAIRMTGADVVAAGNIGCILQLQDDLGLPIVHTVELLDWASGGKRPWGISSSMERPAIPAS